ncbi:MAG: M28 family peptidase [Candidatus Hodarchaeota archaeon]
MINKRYYILIIVVFAFIALLSILFIFFSSNNLSIRNYDIELEFDGDNAYIYVQDQLDMGFRIPGTQERVNCANYFITKFKEINSNFNYVLHNFTSHLTDCQNVLFKLNENYSNIIIFGAHYDSRAKATKDPIIANRNNPVPGANDGASGSAVLIELARVLYTHRINLSCQIWFLFFDAEDQGLDGGVYGIDGWDWSEGSQSFVNEIDSFYNSGTENFDCMVLLDMVGNANLQFINEQYSTSSLLDEIFSTGRQLGYTSQFPTNPETASIIDDHKAFLDFGIPSADLIINFWNNPSWPYHHTTQDSISHILNTSLEITGKTIEQFIYNNYFEDLNNTYQGNYPWNEDTNVIDTEILITIIITISVASIIIVVMIILKRVQKK